MKIQPNDWKLTAYALGELDDEQRAEIEAQLADSPELRQIVVEIRVTAGVLSADLAPTADASLTDAQRQKLETAAAERNGHAAGDGVTTGTRRSIIRKLWLPTALAASLLLLVSIIVPSLSAVRGRAKIFSRIDASLTPAPSALPTGNEATSGGSKLYFDKSKTRSDATPLAYDAKFMGSGTAVPLTPQQRQALQQLGYVATSTRVSYAGQQTTPDQRIRGYDGSSGTPEQQEALREFFNGVAGDDDAGPVDLLAVKDALESQDFRVLGGVLRPEPAAREAYDYIPENPFLRVSDSPLSTFSIDVDTASYANVRRFLTSGQLPPPGAVRIEELINYFSYDYPQPTGDDPFSVNVEIADCPWDANHRLARVGLKGYEIAAEDRVPANLVFLIDVSGSMQAANKLSLLKTALIMLASELNDDDYVSIVVYAGASGLVLPSTPVRSRGTIIDAVGRLTAGGSTNGGAGIQLAYQQAMDNFIDGGVNRVILATDGDFNVGTTDQSSLIRIVEEKAKSNVFLTVLGFGMGNLQDSMLEKLADKGNGNYAYIDNVNEAEKVLVEQIGGTLVTIAKDVKIQVEFNPAEVAAYRLVGYENRLLAAQDFNDDTKDAGEIGAGHTVTAFYEIIPVGEEVDLPDVDPLKYQTPQDEADAAFSGELMTVKLRYKPPDGDTSKLIERPVVDTGMTLDEASSDFVFAASVASFGMLLRHSNHSGNFDLPAVREWAASTLGDNPDPYRAEFVELVGRAIALSGADE